MAMRTLSLLHAGAIDGDELSNAFKLLGGCTDFGDAAYYVTAVVNDAICIQTRLTATSTKFWMPASCSLEATVTYHGVLPCTCASYEL